MNHVNKSIGSDDPKKSEISPMVAGIAGAVVGAGLGVAGAMAMQDDKIRGKVQQVGKTISKKTGDYVNKMKKEAGFRLEEKASQASKAAPKIATKN